MKPTTIKTANSYKNWISKLLCCISNASLIFAVFMYVEVSRLQTSADQLLTFNNLDNYGDYSQVVFNNASCHVQFSSHTCIVNYHTHRHVYMSLNLQADLLNVRYYITCILQSEDLVAIFCNCWVLQSQIHTPS